MKNTLLYSLTAGLALGLATAHASLEIEEQFDYTAGDLAGNGTGTTGLAGNWTSPVVGPGKGDWEVMASGLSFTDHLSDAGGSAERNAASGSDYAQVEISAAAQTNLLADGSTAYFSFLVGFPGGNAETFDNHTFYIGTNDTPDSAADPVTTTGGSGFGFAIDGANGNNGPRPLRAFTMDNGSSTLSAGDIGDVPDESSPTQLIVGQLDWVANGGNDTLTLWNVADPTIGLGTNSVSMTADLDQSLFDTLTIASKQNNVVFDEIRFGTTLGDVSTVAVPEPSSYALLAGMFGLTLVMLRRRQG